MSIGYLQFEIAGWVTRNFGHAVFESHEERGRRFAEEAIELNQALGVSKEDIIRLVNRVYSKPVGDVAQEIGGVGITLLGLCQSVGFNFEEVTEKELAYLQTLSKDFLRKRHAAKVAAGVSMELIEDAA